MKASIKRFVWFFGINFLMMITEYFDFLINGTGWDLDKSGALFYLALMVIPLFMFEDDVEKGATRK